MRQSFVTMLSTAGRAAVVLLTIEIAAVSALRYVLNSEPPPPPIIRNASANPFLIIHVVSGVTALLLGPLQFVERIRLRKPGLHRVTGRLHVGACAVAAPSAFMLAVGTTAGPVAAVGFATPALLLPVFTYMGWRTAVERRFDEHREWMLRSYALTATAITLRLMLPGSALLGLQFFPAYRVIAWISWMTNLLLFELYIRRKRLLTTRYGALASA